MRATHRTNGAVQEPSAERGPEAPAGPAIPRVHCDPHYRMWRTTGLADKPHPTSRPLSSTQTQTHIARAPNASFRKPPPRCTAHKPEAANRGPVISYYFPGRGTLQGRCASGERSGSSPHNAVCASPGERDQTVGKNQTATKTKYEIN